MKALTIKEPWASLIINGYKGYEFRTWKTNYRGKILIHAGMSLDKKIAKRFTNYHIKYNKGAIIGEAVISDCFLVDNDFNNKLYNINKDVYGDNYVGVYAWKLEKVIKYDKPIYCKGKLGLWNYDIDI